MTARHALPVEPQGGLGQLADTSSGSYRIVLRHGGRHVAPRRWASRLRRAAAWLLPVLQQLAIALLVLTAAGASGAIAIEELGQGRWHTCATAAFTAAGLTGAGAVVLQHLLDGSRS